MSPELIVLSCYRVFARLPAHRRLNGTVFSPACCVCVLTCRRASPGRIEQPAHRCRPVYPARVAMDEPVQHRVPCNCIEQPVGEADVAQGLRQAEFGSEVADDVGCVTGQGQTRVSNGNKGKQGWPIPPPRFNRKAERLSRGRAARMQQQTRPQSRPRRRSALHPWSRQGSGCR